MSVLGDVRTSHHDRIAQIERIYRERYAPICRMATAVTGRVDAGHDAVQDGFALALAHHGEFRGEGSLEGWVRRIVLRVALDSRRRRKIETVLPEELGAETVLWVPQLPHAERDPELAAALQALPPRQQQFVFLRYIADFSHSEIAETAGVAPGTVSATLNQARATLARRLERSELINRETQQ